MFSLEVITFFFCGAFKFSFWNIFILWEFLYSQINQNIFIFLMNNRLLFPCRGFPGGSDSKESAWKAGDPGSGISFEEGNGNPLQYFCLENSMDKAPCAVTVHGVTKSWTWLSDFTHFGSANSYGIDSYKLYKGEIKIHFIHMEAKMTQYHFSKRSFPYALQICYLWHKLGHRLPDMCGSTSGHTTLQHWVICVSFPH